MIQAQQQLFGHDLQSDQQIFSPIEEGSQSTNMYTESTNMYTDCSTDMDVYEAGSPGGSSPTTSPIGSPGFSYYYRGVPYFSDPVAGALIQPNPVFKPHRVLSASVVSACAGIFFQKLYPIMPIFDKSHFQTAYLTQVHTSPQIYGLVASMCALTVIQLCAVPEKSGNGTEGTESSWEPGVKLGIPSEYPLEKLGKTLIAEALRARRLFEYIAKPDLDTVITSFFLFCCYGNLERHEHAWYYLRESISLVQGMGLDDENTYWWAELRAGNDRTQKSLLRQWRRMFWLLFITERSVDL